MRKNTLYIGIVLTFLNIFGLYFYTGYNKYISEIKEINKTIKVFEYQKPKEVVSISVSGLDLSNYQKITSELYTEKNILLKETDVNSTFVFRDTNDTEFFNKNKETYKIVSHFVYMEKMVYINQKDLNNSLYAEIVLLAIADNDRGHRSYLFQENSFVEALIANKYNFESKDLVKNFVREELLSSNSYLEANYFRMFLVILITGLFGLVLFVFIGFFVEDERVDEDIIANLILLGILSFILSPFLITVW